MKNVIKTSVNKVKSTFTKQNCKNAAIKGICHTLGAGYFVAQGAADILKHTEGAIVNKIDSNIDAANVRECREAIYNKDVATINLGVTIAKQKYIHAKHAVERKIDVMLHGPLPAMDGHEATELGQMNASNAGIV